MNHWFNDPVGASTDLGLALLSLAVLISFFRLVRGPSLPDRLMALDATVIQLVGVVALFAIVERRPEYLTGAAVLALINFLGSVAFAYYIHRKVLS